MKGGKGSGGKDGEKGVKLWVSVGERCLQGGFKVRKRERVVRGTMLNYGTG